MFSVPRCGGPPRRKKGSGTRSGKPEAKGGVDINVEVPVLGLSVGSERPLDALARTQQN